ncbi:MAG: serine hydrolase domain-containing protein [Ornithinimicrobium sp.]
MATEATTSAHRPGLAPGTQTQREAELVDFIAEVAEEAGFSGVVGYRRQDRSTTAAYGLADRAHERPMTVDTQLALASGSKAFTALAVMSLIEDGVLTLSTTARSLLGEDLPLIDDDVTVEHLLSHRSGIGDYLDEDLITDSGQYLMARPVHELVDAEAFVPLLAGFETKFAAGTDFSYCNGGYIVLAVVAERASGQTYHHLVRERVCRRAGLSDTDFVRSDDLPARAALGYVRVDGHWRTNVFHLPVLGNGDGGIYSTVSDIERFWDSLWQGRVVSPATVLEMMRPRSESGNEYYGLGFWLPGPDGVAGIVGEDAGVSFHSNHDREAQITRTVIANTADGAWPVVRRLRDFTGG